MTTRPAETGVIRLPGAAFRNPLSVVVGHSSFVVGRLAERRSQPWHCRLKDTKQQAR